MESINVKSFNRHGGALGDPMERNDRGDGKEAEAR